MHGPPWLRSVLHFAGPLAGLALATLAVACGPSPKKHPISSGLYEGIIGGSDVLPNDPIAASVVGLTNISDGTICSASILSANLVLTAAHCLRGEPGEHAVVFGTRFDSPETTMRTVTNYVYGPMWNRRRLERLDTGDIALVRFDGGLPRNYRPTALLTSGEALSNGRLVVLAGFGMNDGARKLGTGQLRHVDAPIAVTLFARSETLLDQTQGRGACHGDSGGPAYVRQGDSLLLWGITSRGVRDPANDCSQFAVYTNILPYLKWIRAAARHLNESAPRPFPRPSSGHSPWGELDR